MKESSARLGLQFAFWSSVYDVSTRAIGYGPRFRNATLSAMGMAGFPRRGTIIDAGCGTGQLIVAMLGCLGSGATIVGIDPEPSMLAVAKRVLGPSIRRDNHVRIKLVKGHVQQLPFGTGSTDAAVVSMTLHHLDRRQKLLALRELHRVLRPGGKLLCVDFSLVPRPGRRAIISWLILLGFLYFNAIETIAGDFRQTVVDHFTGVLPTMLAKAGFSRLKYLEPGFRKAIFLTCQKGVMKDS